MNCTVLEHLFLKQPFPITVITQFWSIEITFILLVQMKDAKNTYIEDYKAKEMWKYLELQISNTWLKGR